ncbi:MAG: tetratricopeptide repeat protein, partial [Candidatus Limnocylindrales bacterium]
TVTDLDAVVRQHPDDPEALVALGDAQLSTGDSGAAISTYERALAVQPDNAAAALALGVVLLSAGQAAQAKMLFDRVLAAQPAQPDALLYRALARFQLGEPAAQIRTDALAFLAVAGNDPRRTVAEQLLDFAPTPTP